MAVSIERLAALGQTGEDNSLAPSLVLIHGWGMSSVVWQDWIPLLRQRCHVYLVDLPGFGPLSEWENSLGATLSAIDRLLAHCIERLPERAVYIGFSLGGMLATRLAAIYPGRISALVTIASNRCFVASDSWPTAMLPETFDTFYQLYETRPEAATKRFMALQLSGSENEKQLLKKMRQRREKIPPRTEASMTYLQQLKILDVDADLRQLQTPSLHLFGERDALVPAQAAQEFSEQYKKRVEIIPGAAHLPFLSHPQRSWAAIEKLLEDNALFSVPVSSRSLQKIYIARSFSRAAHSYDSVAQLQREVGEQLLSFLPASTATAVMDLGCGTGFFLDALRERNPDSHLLAVDLAEGMVTYARQQKASLDCRCLCGDAENLPLADNSLELIFSSLAIQWCEDIDALFAEIHRVLAPGGSFVFSTLGPNTLRELCSAWSEVDDYTHVNRFIDQAALLKAMSGAGFDELSLSEQNRQLEYSTLRQLTHELKSLGAHNVNRGRPGGLMGRQRIKQFSAAYEAQRNSGGMLPASYQVWYGVLTKNG